MGIRLKNSDECWQNMRQLYPAYLSMAREFALEAQPCRELEEELDLPSAEALAAATRWFDEIDSRMQIHHLRQFLQNWTLLEESVLTGLLARHCSKENRSEHDRDKVDFLLVQLFSLRARADISGPGLSLAVAAQVMEPVLGQVDIEIADWLQTLDDLLAKVFRAKTLNELFTARVIEEGRRIKHACAEKFFEPQAMLESARFGFLVRRAFFRLMHQDLNAILDGLRELEERGATTLDCRKAQFAAHEPIARLRMICLSWKVMFQAEYSAGQPLCIVVDLRTAVEAALMHTSAAGPKAKAVAAGGVEF